MAITAIWTAHCDLCAHWDESVMGDTRVEVRAAAKRAGWRVGLIIVLCPDCDRTDRQARDEFLAKQRSALDGAE